MNQLAYTVARWVYAEDKKLIDNIKGLDSGMLVYDQKDRPVILVNNEWSLNWILERNPGIQFLTVPSDVAKIQILKYKLCNNLSKVNCKNFKKQFML